MLEIVKYGTNQYGRVWVIGNLKMGDIEVLDLFNTNLSDEDFFKDKTSVKANKFKISKNKNKQVIFTLEF